MNSAGISMTVVHDLVDKHPKPLSLKHRNIKLRQKPRSRSSGSPSTEKTETKEANAEVKCTSTTGSSKSLATARRISSSSWIGPSFSLISHLVKDSENRTQ